MYQKFVAIGRISEPEARENANQNLFLRFGVAVQEKKDDPPTWINSIISGRFAEVMQDRLAKGQLVFVEGRLSMREKDGKTYTNLMVDVCRILRDPSSESGGSKAAE